MPKSFSGSLDPRVFLQHSDSIVACLICPKKNGLYPTMNIRHVKGHQKTQTHTRREAHALRVSRSQEDPTPHHPGPTFSTQPDIEASSDNVQEVPSHQPSTCTTDVDMDEVFRTLESVADIPIVDEDESAVPISSLASSISKSRIFQFLETEQPLHPFTIPLSPPPTEELGLDDQDWNEDFGIELPDQPQPSASPPTSSATYPWPSMAMFITHLLFSSARLRFSDAQKKAILSWANELNAPDVPTLSALKQCQERILKLVGNPTQKVTSPNNNIFYVNDIGRAIANDYANPLTRFTMEDYAEDRGGSISQVRHGSKMLLDIPPEVTTPTIRINNNIFYVNELLQRSSGSYFIPERFFFRSQASSVDTRSDAPQEKVMYALGHDVERTELGFIVCDESVISAASTFSRSFEDILANGDEFECGFTASSSSYGTRMPHPLRAIAKDRMVYSVPLIIFMDDVSANVSKQWNKHHVVYVSNANMPREMIEKEFCIRFVTSSPHAAPMELMTAVKDSISKAAESGIITWDCKNDEEVVLMPYGLFWAGDNPMQAEECSHGGLNCNYFCRTCKVGGTKEFKESEDGFDTIFKSGVLHSVEETDATIRDQLNAALQSGGTEKVRKLTTATGIRDTTVAAIVESLLKMGKELRKREPGKPQKSVEEVHKILEDELEQHMKTGTINPLIGMPGVDIHMDTPTEILHTVLLGVVKYYWGQTVWLLEKSNVMDVFQTRLASVNEAGLNIPKISAEYICKYKGGLIGKHFKSLAQVMPFLVYDLVPANVLDAWNILGDLVVLLWHTKIENMEEYLAALSRTIDDFLHITAQCAPSILILKPKFHFLIHLPAYIRRFGPALLFSTERYESFNHIFRLAAIYSNRQAPSRDTCNIFAAQDAFKHLAFGGFFLDPASKKWRRAGPNILDYMSKHPEHSRLLGLKPEKQPIAGEATLQPLVRANGQRAQRPPPVQWKETECAQIVGVGAAAPLPTTLFHKATAFVACEGDSVDQDAFVVYRRKSDNILRPAQVVEILAPKALPEEVSHVKLRLFNFKADEHPLLRLPCLVQSTESIVVCAADIICAVNVQHDCSSSGCKEYEQVSVVQERMTSDRKRLLIKHADDTNFVLNTNSLHNYSTISALLSDHFSTRQRLTLDKPQIRKTAVRQMRDTKSRKKQADDSGIEACVESSGDASHAHEVRPVFERSQPKTKAKTNASSNTRTAPDRSMSRSVVAGVHTSRGASASGSHGRPASSASSELPLERQFVHYQLPASSLSAVVGVRTSQGTSTSGSPSASSELPLEWQFVHYQP